MAPVGCMESLHAAIAAGADAVYFGVGAAFNFHAGLVKQAPAWVRSHGLEWLYRLCKEPRRLFKRYLVHNTRFLWYCLTRKV